ncbi:phage portal protein [Streptomyces nogalater]
MSLRDRLAKAFGARTPTDMQAGEEAAGMTPTRPFSPGAPISPYDGYSRTPGAMTTSPGTTSRPGRRRTSASASTRSAAWSRHTTSHRCASGTASTPSAPWTGPSSPRAASAVTPTNSSTSAWPSWPSRTGDAVVVVAGDLAVRHLGVRRRPLPAPEPRRPCDRSPRRRRHDHRPLLDYWGNSPEPPAEAYVQYVNGLPWNWLTRNDLVYVPFRPRSNSPYGYAPLESILLNSNTDLRFQAYFLQRFTEGNIPEAFASAPETWTPQQIEEFQGYWDAAMYGDQAAKHQIRWMPGGGRIEWSNEKDFSDSFSLFLMRKTCAAYHIVPSDLGFTETVNKSSGETQADVQHRVGDLPLIAHIEDVLTHFLQHDLGLPLKMAFDTGQEKEDRLQLAQAWGIYIDKGMASPDEGREELLGLPADPRAHAEVLQQHQLRARPAAGNPGPGRCRRSRDVRAGRGAADTGPAGRHAARRRPRARYDRRGGRRHRRGCLPGVRT